MQLRLVCSFFRERVVMFFKLLTECKKFHILSNSVFFSKNSGKIANAFSLCRHVTLSLIEDGLGLLYTAANRSSHYEQNAFEVGDVPQALIMDF